MNINVHYSLLFIAAYIELSATEELRLCADASVLSKKFPQLSDCILTWIKRIPENIDDYCTNSKDLQDFCSRLDKYSKETHDSKCSSFRSNLDNWIECMAFFNFRQQAICRSDLKCPRIALYDAIPKCNFITSLEDYQACIESGSEAAPSLLKDEYFGVPTYLIVIIVVLCLVLIALLILYKTEQRRKRRKTESLDKVRSVSSAGSAGSAGSSLSTTSLTSPKSKISKSK